jgi:hypothetical protein
MLSRTPKVQAHALISGYFGGRRTLGTLPGLILARNYIDVDNIQATRVFVLSCSGIRAYFRHASILPRLYLTLIRPLRSDIHLLLKAR